MQGLPCEEAAPAAVVAAEGEQGQPGHPARPLLRRTRCFPYQSTGVVAGKDRHVEEADSWGPTDLHGYPGEPDDEASQSPLRIYPMMVSWFRELRVQGFIRSSLLLLQTDLSLLHLIDFIPNKVQLLELVVHYHTSFKVSIC